MFGRLLKRLFGGRDVARPVSPPPPPIPKAAPAAHAPPPPPPPVPSASKPPAEEPSLQTAPPLTEPITSASRTITDPGRVRFVLEDGTLAEPEIDPEFEERLRYLVDNIVPPTDPPTT